MHTKHFSSPETAVWFFFSDMDISASSQNHAANIDHCKYPPMNNSVSQIHKLKLKCVLRLRRTAVNDG